MLLGEQPDCVEDDIHEGFMTSIGRFVDRKEAHDIAVANNQTRGSNDGALLIQDLH